jgi:predicted DNA-binding protein (MmcQ/YjbR family)
MTRQELIDYCLTLPDAYTDYPFEGAEAHSDDGRWAMMRHGINKKGFAHIYERNGKLCINLKCDPAEADFLRQVYTDVTPGWHMNKTHWNTVTLGGDVPEDELKNMIESSYDLIKPKVRKQKIYEQQSTQNNR